MSSDDKRAQFIADLRAFADLIETNPVLPTPNFGADVWAFLSKDQGTEEQRFNAVHDFAEAYGVDVTEDSDGDRRAEKKFGAVEYKVHAYCDGSVSKSRPRVVTRPGAQSGGAL